MRLRSCEIVEDLVLVQRRAARGHGGRCCSVWARRLLATILQRTFGRFSRLLVSCRRLKERKLSSAFHNFPDGSCDRWLLPGGDRFELSVK